MIRWCADCRERVAIARGYCDRCRKYRDRKGCRRPKYLDAQKCRNCGRPKNSNHRKGYCGACRAYYYEHKQQRPIEFEQRLAPLGRCDCGNPAQEEITVMVGMSAGSMGNATVKMKLCANCAELENS